MSFESIPGQESQSSPRGKYILETCEPGKNTTRYTTGCLLLLTITQRITGDLVLIHGSVLHKSERNTSQNTRFAYTFHMIEGPEKAQYDEKNWLQPTLDMPFSRLFA